MTPLFLPVNTLLSVKLAGENILFLSNMAAA
jgi:hypothetical protein